MSRDVTVRISATDNFSSVIQKYQMAVKDAGTHTKNLNTASNETSQGGLTRLNNTMNQLMGVFAGIQILNTVGDLLQLGNQANATEATFVALAGGAGEANAALALMRQETGGIVGDLDLMTGANKLFSMQLAQTGDDAAKMASVAITLSRAMGEMDSGRAIENFALMLSNTSLLRLDTLGISSSRVRERMKELAEEFPNLDKQARFTQATMEEAERSLQRLGPAAQAGTTGIARLQTTMENFKTDLGQRIADTVNTALASFEQLMFVIETSTGARAPVIDQQAIIDNARALAEEYGDTFANSTQGVDFGGESAEGFLQRIEEAKIALGETATAAELVKKAGEDMWMSPENIALATDGYEWILTLQQASADSLARQQQRTDALRQSELLRFQAYQENYALPETGGSTDVGPMNLALFGSSLAIEQSRMGIDSMIDYAQDKMAQFSVTTQGIDTFLNPAAAGDIQQRFEELQDLADQGLIPQDEVDKMGEFDDAAARAADRLLNLKMPDLFGQTDGGVGGQIAQDFLQQMQDSGNFDDATLENFAGQLGLATGMETVASQAYEEVILPMLQQIYQQYGADAATQAVLSAQAYFQGAAANNFTPEQIAADMGSGAVTGYVNSGTPGGSFTIAPGMGLNEIAAQTGLTPQQVLQYTGAANASSVPTGSFNIPGGVAPMPGYTPGVAYGLPTWAAQGVPQNKPMTPMQAVGMNPYDFLMGTVTPSDTGADSTTANNPFEHMQESSEEVVTNVDLMRSGVSEISTVTDDIVSKFDSLATPRSATINITWNDQTGLLKLLMGASGGLPVSIGGGSDPRNNGGRVPGQDNRTSSRNSQVGVED